MASIFPALHESLRQVLADRLDWTGLREVQERAYAAVAGGSDALIIAPTAGGKSEAALIPVIDDILKNGRPGIACLYIAPLKALINDQEERFLAFCTPTSLGVMKWHGDVAKGDRSWKGEPPHFLMITPESLGVLLQEPELIRDLCQVRYIIIDELHAFVETERGVHLKVLLAEVDRRAGRNVQRIGLSATMGNPAGVLSWLADGRQGEELVQVPQEPKEKHFRFVMEADEGERTEALIRTVAGKKALVFVNSRSMAEALVQAAAGRVANLHIHHSSLAPSMRKAAEDAFLAPDGACIICTSTLELGIDIGDLDVVVQVGPPATVSSFLQRMGRSGRRGKAANVTWIVRDPCELLCSIAIIECAMKKAVEDLRPQKRPYPVLVQQLFLLLHRNHAVSRQEAARRLLSHPAFAGLDPNDPDRVIRHLLAEGFLTADGEMLMPGTRAEQEYGRSNWKDLYSVIAGGGEYRAVTPDGDVVGMLDARFVNSSRNGDVSLGGRSWSMVKCDEDRDMVVVVPGEGASGAKTFWTGGGDHEGFSMLICRQVRQILSRGRSLLPLAPVEEEIISSLASRLRPLARGRGLVVAEHKGTRGREVVAATFCGSRFNRVLAHLLKRKLGSRAMVRYDDLVIRVRRAGKEGAAERVAAALESIRGMERARMASALPLPPPESWKFARVLPRDLFSAFVAADYYHLDEFILLFAEMDVRVLPPPPPPADGPT